jgi:hypothetical protein
VVAVIATMENGKGARLVIVIAVILLGRKTWLLF